MKKSIRSCSKRTAMVALLAAGLLLGATAPAQAIDFKAKGQWLMGFGLGQANLVKKENHNRVAADDTFRAGQRIRLQLDAVASENLSGTVYFEIGDTVWGHSASGGSLGSDGVIVEVKRAYLDWAVPNTDLSVRMGLVGLMLPNVAGGSAILDSDVAAVQANYKFNDNVSLSAFWARPANDNFANDGPKNSRRKGFLDNIDLFGLTLPLTFDGVKLTPWAMYGVIGKNALEGYNDDDSWRYKDSKSSSWGTRDGDLQRTLFNMPAGVTINEDRKLGNTSHAYSSMFFAGLPVTISAFDPLNIELDLNYGAVQGTGSYRVLKRGIEDAKVNTKRSGWLVKALVEYKFDWGVPGIFGWYASGDDGSMKNGSERMPSIAPIGNFTSFMGDGNLGWGVPGGDGSGNNAWYDRMLSYAGTWGIGLQLRDMSFVEDLSHTFRVAYWGGTNSPAMTKYFDQKSDWNNGYYADGTYLTTNDGLLEFNLVNSYKIYENLEANLELGYIVNMVDKNTWDRHWMKDSMQRQDAWKAQLTFGYSF